jgi:hypothetical protein
MQTQLSQVSAIELEEMSDLMEVKDWVLRLWKTASAINELLTSDIMDDVLHWRGKMRNYENALDELSRLEKENSELKIILST